MFTPFPKIPRLKRGCVITEKLDGTNAQVFILPEEELPPHDASDEDYFLAKDRGLVLMAGSRGRWVRPGKEDNYGFAGWVKAHAADLWSLGPGRHYGEWWGQGIQRRYDLWEKRFSLFNTDRWLRPDSGLPACCGVVPVLYRGPFTDEAVNTVLKALEIGGSAAVPGFMQPEGIVVFHTASRSMFKVTLENDAEAKGQVIANQAS